MLDFSLTPELRSLQSRAHAFGLEVIRAPQKPRSTVMPGAVTVAATAAEEVELLLPSSARVVRMAFRE